MRKWVIEEYDSDRLTASYCAPGNLSDAEMSIIIQQLAARHLQPAEIINANLRRSSLGKTDLLKVKNSSELLEVGQNPFIIARKVSKK